jgi:hypothetical protein
MKATADQVRCLQTLWGRYAQAADLDDGGREKRLQWATQQLGRAVASFTELHGAEAGVLIDALKGALGQPVSALRRKRMDREQAEVFSKHGKHGYTPEAEVLATDADREEIYLLAARVGMTREQLDTWLASRHSPLGRAGGRLLTMTHIGKARWALKSMLRRKALERVS